MAGQWVVPGAGGIPTLVSGKHAAMPLRRRDGKTFYTSSEVQQSLFLFPQMHYITPNRIRQRIEDLLYRFTLSFQLKAIASLVQDSGNLLNR